MDDDIVQTDFVLLWMFNWHCVYVNIFMEVRMFMDDDIVFMDVYILMFIIVLDYGWIDSYCI